MSDTKETRTEIYIEVTRRDGTKAIMKASEFSRLSATELSYSTIRLVDKRKGLCGHRAA